MHNISITSDSFDLSYQIGFIEATIEFVIPSLPLPTNDAAGKNSRTIGSIQIERGESKFDSSTARVVENGALSMPFAHV